MLFCFSQLIDADEIMKVITCKADGKTMSLDRISDISQYPEIKTALEKLPLAPNSSREGTYVAVVPSKGLPYDAAVDVTVGPKVRLLW
jgi:hypothetical protein